MTVLKLKLLKGLEGETSFAAGQIIGASGEIIRNLMIPIGYAATPTDIDLSPGRYLVRARLPSGQTVGKQVNLREGQSDVVSLEAHGSEHEWLSWHHFASGEAQQGTESIDTTSFLGSTRGVLYDLALAANPLPIPSLFLPGPDHVFEQLSLEQSGDCTIDRESLQLDINTYHDDRHVLVRVKGNDTGSARDWRRVFVGARLEDGLRQLIAVPIPWPKVADSFTPESEIVEVLLARPSAVTGRASGYSPPKLITSTVIRDPVFGAVIGFLASGDQPSAANVTNELHDGAKQLLFDKLGNPYAAAAGGYVLLSTYRHVDPPNPSVRKEPEWFRWTKNLMDWFPWLPDGAIINGWLHLQRGRDVDTKTARGCFLTAAQRGVPIFTAGLKLLVQGLTILDYSSKDAEVVAALSKVRPFAAAVDPSQPFCTFYGSDPLSPTFPPIA
jgi:hypothetical protein